jgi:hypothetical protein
MLTVSCGDGIVSSGKERESTGFFDSPLPKDRQRYLLPLFINMVVSTKPRTPLRGFVYLSDMLEYPVLPARFPSLRVTSIIVLVQEREDFLPEIRGLLNLR